MQNVHCPLTAGRRPARWTRAAARMNDQKEANSVSPFRAGQKKTGAASTRPEGPGILPVYRLRQQSGLRDMRTKPCNGPYKQ